MMVFMAAPSKRPNVTATLGNIPEGAPGIAATLRIMREMVKEGQSCMVVRNQVIDLCRNVEQKNFWKEAEACHTFVRDEIRYMQDPLDFELVQVPRVTLQLSTGDCDDKATLICAMLECMGHPTRFVAVGFKPGIFEHVYAETMIGRKWIALETTEPVPIGWQPPDRIIKARMYG